MNPRMASLFCINVKLDLSQDFKKNACLKQRSQNIGLSRFSYSASSMRLPTTCNDLLCKTVYKKMELFLERTTNDFV